jgi:hypothetical protein
MEKDDGTAIGKAMQSKENKKATVTLIVAIITVEF